jgi:hypothetical protein
LAAAVAASGPTASAPVIATALTRLMTLLTMVKPP